VYGAWVGAVIRGQVSPSLPPEVKARAATRTHKYARATPARAGKEPQEPLAQTCIFASLTVGVCTG